MRGKTRARKSLSQFWLNFPLWPHGRLRNPGEGWGEEEEEEEGGVHAVSRDLSQPMNWGGGNWGGGEGGWGEWAGGRRKEGNNMMRALL